MALSSNDNNSNSNISSNHNCSNSQNNNNIKLSVAVATTTPPKTSTTTVTTTVTTTATTTATVFKLKFIFPCQNWNDSFWSVATRHYSIRELFCPQSNGWMREEDSNMKWNLFDTREKIVYEWRNILEMRAKMFQWLVLEKEYLS